MAIQGQKIHPYCGLRQEILVYSDVLVRATLLFHGPDAVRTSVGRDSSMMEAPLLSIESPLSRHYSCQSLWSPWLQPHRAINSCWPILRCDSSLGVAVLIHLGIFPCIHRRNRLSRSLDRWFSRRDLWDPAKRNWVIRDEKWVWMAYFVRGAFVWHGWFRYQEWGNSYCCEHALT